jgi:hypothetical protein
MTEEQFLKGFRKHVVMFSKKISSKQMIKNIRSNTLDPPCPFYSSRSGYYCLGKNGKVTMWNSDKLATSYREHVSYWVNHRDEAVGYIEYTSLKKRMIKIIKEEVI